MSHLKLIGMKRRDLQVLRLCHLIQVVQPYPKNCVQYNINCARVGMYKWKKVIVLFPSSRESIIKYRYSHKIRTYIGSYVYNTKQQQQQQQCSDRWTLVSLFSWRALKEVSKILINVKIFGGEPGLHTYAVATSHTPALSALLLNLAPL